MNAQAQAGAVVLTAYFHPAVGRYDEAVAAIASVVNAIHDESGCVLYAMHQPPGKDHILVLEKWNSQTALDAHSTGEPLQQLRTALKGLVAKPAEVTAYTPVPAGRRHGQLPDGPSQGAKR